MKKIGILRFAIYIFSLAVVFSGIYFFADIKQDKEISDTGEYGEDDVMSPSQKTSDKISESTNHVTYASVNGYLMKAESGNVNIYEVYDNGHKERIKTLDINPDYMRKNDFDMLSEGITVKSYEEICSLIEDFSS